MVGGGRVEEYIASIGRKGSKRKDEASLEALGGESEPLESPGSAPRATKEIKGITTNEGEEGCRRDGERDEGICSKEGGQRGSIEEGQSGGITWLKGSPLEGDGEGLGSHRQRQHRRGISKEDEGEGAGEEAEATVEDPGSPHFLLTMVFEVHEEGADTQEGDVVGCSSRRRGGQASQREWVDECFLPVGLGRSRHDREGDDGGNQ